MFHKTSYPDFTTYRRHVRMYTWRFKTIMPKKKKEKKWQRLTLSVSNIRQRLTFRTRKHLLSGPVLSTKMAVILKTKVGIFPDVKNNQNMDSVKFKIRVIWIPYQYIWLVPLTSMFFIIHLIIQLQLILTKKKCPQIIAFHMEGITAKSLCISSCFYSNAKFFRSFTLVCHYCFYIHAYLLSLWFFFDSLLFV